MDESEHLQRSATLIWGVVAMAATTFSEGPQLSWLSDCSLSLFMLMLFDASSMLPSQRGNLNANKCAANK